MTTKTIGSCASCGYPLTARYEGYTVTCPMCKTANEAVTVSPILIPDVFIPILLGAGLGIGIIIGVVIGKQGR